jgi:Zn-dependent peptidase ImmA (M78 family)
MHEVCHAIFDAETAGATLDLVDDQNKHDLSEERADAFAQEVLVPRQVIQHVAQKNGIMWDNLSARDLAVLVAETQVEKRMVLQAAAEAGLLLHGKLEAYLELDISSLLPKFSDHALTTEEYIDKIGGETAAWVGKRTTTIPSKSLRLPAAYVKAVVAAFQEEEISSSKAAEMLMIDEHTFADRFGDLLDESEELALLH